jgi:DNA-binding transcriptional LysR family regulator
LEVSKTLHFGKAAENLYLTSAAVSARIRQLEEYFNTALFTRQRNSIKLTPAGEKLLPFAHQLVGSLKQARLILSEQEADFITCGATPNAASLILDSLLKTCRAKFPETALSTEIHCTEQLSRQLHERTIDFAFTTEPLKSADIETIKLREEGLFLFSTEVVNGQVDHQHFVHIEWSRKATLALLSAYPLLKHYQYKTNDALAAIVYVNEHAGNIVLPEFLKHKLNKIDEFTQQQIGSLEVYCARLKERPHPIVDNVIASLLASNNTVAKSVRT